MANHHPSRSWRGCALCKPHKRRGAGRATKDPVATRRRLGRSRRYSRRSLGGDCPFSLNLGHDADSDLRCPRWNENRSVGLSHPIWGKSCSVRR